MMAELLGTEGTIAAVAAAVLAAVGYVLKLVVSGLASVGKARRQSVTDQGGTHE